jgi:peptide/nickel transport system ATP-binding protein
MSALRGETDTAVGETLLEAENVRKYYDEGGVLSDPPVKAVDGVSLSVKRGETLAVVGESGSGKTTLGRSLARLDQPTDGTVEFDGRDISRVSGEALTRYRRRCQMVFQDPDSSLNDRQTVGEIIREPLDVHGWKTAPERRERVIELLDAVGLSPDRYARYPHQFSGGQRQRVAIARALALEPDFLVLDEPVSALDVSVQAQILSLLDELQSEMGLTYLFITHDLGVVRHVADRVVVLYLGEVMERGPVDAVLDDPANPYTESLLTATPEPDPDVELDPVSLRGSPPDPRHPPAGCPFASRCPVAIHEGVDATAETAEAVQALRAVLRERTVQRDSLGTRVLSLLGRGSRTGVDELRADLFDGVDPGPEALDAIDAVFAAYRDRGPEAALDRLDDAFGSVCTTADPGLVETGASESRCHRHRSDHADHDGMR